MTLDINEQIQDREDNISFKIFSFMKQKKEDVVVTDLIMDGAIRKLFINDLVTHLIRYKIY